MLEQLEQQISLLQSLLKTSQQEQRKVFELLLAKELKLASQCRRLLKNFVRLSDLPAIKQNQLLLIVNGLTKNVLSFLLHRLINELRRTLTRLIVEGWKTLLELKLPEHRILVIVKGLKM